MKTSLARHRDDGSQLLRIHLPVDKLLDAERCDSLSADIRTFCGSDGWEVRKATSSLGRYLPDECGLYMFVWKPHLTVPLAVGHEDRRLWFVIYVGQAGGDGGSGTLRSRYTSEYRKYVAKDPERLWANDEPVDREGRLGCFLNLEDLEYWFVASTDFSRLLSLERRLIRILNPPLNDHGGTKLRVVSRTPAF